MSNLPQISEAEFEVMKIVWKHAPISTNEITDKFDQMPLRHQQGNQTTCDKRRSDLWKTEPGVCLHPCRERKRIHRSEKQLFFGAILWRGYHCHAVCIYKKWQTVRSRNRHPPLSSFQKVKKGRRLTWLILWYAFWYATFLSAVSSEFFW